MFSKKTILTTFVSLLFLSLFLLFCAAPAVFAAEQLVPCGGPGQHSCTICDFFEMTKRATNYIIFGIIPVTAAFLLLLGGSYLIWTKGDPKALTNAKTAIRVTIYGFVGVFVGWVFLNTAFMAFGVADWNGFRLDESWWKISAKCSVSWEEKESCGDGILQDGENCDPKMTIEGCQGKFGYSAELCEIVKSKCDPKTCTAEWCGDGIKQENEKCDPNEPVDLCVERTKWKESKCLDFVQSCGQDCEILKKDACGEGEDKSKIGMGCWLSNDITKPEKYCQRGKYICDEDPESPTYDKIICKPLKPKLLDECCYDRGEGLDKVKFEIVRIRDYVKLGSVSDLDQIAGGGTIGQMIPCMSKSINCDTVCRKKNMVCIGVGLISWQKNKCVSVIHHDANDCNLSTNLASNDCRSNYCLTDAVCCEGGKCKEKLEPCCDPEKKEKDPYWQMVLTGTGAKFSVGETACYCK